ncbi:MAG: hypothetical protein V4667_13930 [Bacteroidota bacterium]
MKISTLKKITTQIIGVVLVFILHYNLSKLDLKKTDKTSENILLKVGMGQINLDSLQLTTQQKEEIRTIINTNPNNYNAAQKALIQENSGIEILTEIGLGKKKAEDFILSREQLDEIDSLIKNNPNNYNSAQKSILLNRNN